MKENKNNSYTQETNSKQISQEPDLYKRITSKLDCIEATINHTQEFLSKLEQELTQLRKQEGEK